MRTEAEKLTFAKECQEIEKAGGDVLGYIETNWPSYTPRATWYNLQKTYLKRKELTEGHPTDVPMTKRHKDAMGRYEEMARGLVDKANGSEVREWLLGFGYKDATKALGNAKAWARHNDLELYEQIKGKCMRIGKTQKARKEKKVTFQEWEDMDRPSPTCCQPARPSGVTLPDGKPDKAPAVTGKLPEEGVKDDRKESRIDPADERPKEARNGPEAETPAGKDTAGTGPVSMVEVPRGEQLEICGVKGTFGRFEKLEVFAGMPCMGYKMNDQTEMILFSPENWQLFIREAQMALKQFGL